jgi:DtxR family Mn-dependent transcriptional regulator
VVSVGAGTAGVVVVVVVVVVVAGGVVVVVVVVVVGGGVVVVVVASVDVVVVVTSVGVEVVASVDVVVVVASDSSAGETRERGVAARGASMRPMTGAEIVTWGPARAAATGPATAQTSTAAAAFRNLPWCLLILLLLSVCLPSSRMRRIDHIDREIKTSGEDLACHTIFLMQPNDLVRTPAVEDYAKAIFTLESRNAEPVSTTSLAERLGITAGSVSAMLKRLDELGVIERTPYRGVSLTADGRALALEVIRHHRLIESFLNNTLGMPWDRVHAEAEVLEHVLSEELEELIASKLGHPTVDPHGDPIPTATLELEEPRTWAMETLSPGDRGVFVRVSDSDPEMLRYLAGCGISPGDRFDVRERQPFGGPLLIAFGEREHAIGGQLARAMRVDLDGPESVAHRQEPPIGGEPGLGGG